MTPSAHKRAYDIAYQAQRKAQRRHRRRQLSTPLSGRGTPAIAAASHLRLQHHSNLAAGSPTQKHGRRAEQAAEQWLQSKGVQVLARNLSCRGGELDLVAKHNHTLVFIEVRSRRSASHGGAAASVSRQKRRRLVHAANYFLPDLTRVWFDGRIPPCRFDLITIEQGRLQWLQHI